MTRRPPIGWLAPGRLQWISAAFLLPVLVVLLFGPPRRDNPANLLVWAGWWPLLCVLFLVAGRIWCSLCPFPILGGIAQRAAGLQRAVPDFLRRHAGWLIAIAFLLLTWFEEVFDAVESPRRTAAVLLGIQAGAIVFALFFRGRAWCRYACPLGGISLVYARTALFKVRSSEAACADCATKDCVVQDSGYAGCPMNLTPFAIESAASCIACGACIGRCPSGSVRPAFEAPSLDLSARSFPPPAAVWLVVLLAGQLAFQGALRSPRLPFAEWTLHATNPVFLKTVLMAAATALVFLLFAASLRLAARAAPGIPRESLLALGALPLIPLLLFTHLGILAGRLPADAFGPACVVVGLAWTLFVSRWALAREPELPARRVGWSFAAFYVLVASWSLFVAWPGGGAARGALALAAGSPGDGWAVLWLFAGPVVAVLALALVVRRSERRSASAAASVEFSAARSWNLHDAGPEVRSEILDWFLEQAAQARWRIPPVVSLAQASGEVVTFLRRTLGGGSPITLSAMLRKNKGIVTIFHEGRPLALPEHRPPSSLLEADEAALDGLELRLAEAQVEQLTYQARLSDGRCCFTLRQSCPGTILG